MNCTVTYSTLFRLSNCIPSFYLILLISTMSLRFLVGFSLNCYIIFLLFSNGGVVDMSVIFRLNHISAELLLVTVSFFYILLLKNFYYFGVKLLDFLFGTSMSAHYLFLCCVCLECYLAVVHPVTFLKMKPLRYRVGCSVLVWICSLLLGTATCILFVSAIKILAVVCITVLAVEFFCGVAILRKLRDPGPRDMRREQGEMNAAKKKAFNIVLINLLTVLVQNFPTGLTYSLDNFLSENDYYIALDICLVVNFTTALVQPLFILHKYGKLSFLRFSCKSLCNL